MDYSICVVGLGYVGLPLAVSFSEYFSVVGFDSIESRIKDIQSGGIGNDTVDVYELERAKKSGNIEFVAKLERRAGPTIYIVCVPTPVTENFVPDLSAVEASAATVGSVLKPGDIVVLESTVYPGATQELFAPILSRVSGLVAGKSFGIGYSPERVNPGDDLKRTKAVVKVISASDSITLQTLRSVYSKIIHAGVYEAESIEVAEAAKIVENVQRDVNVALMNHFSEIFSSMNIRLSDVLAAARTKWNFVDFKPGLVGGHCIGVDPYYLVERASQFGVHADLLLLSRVVNERVVSRVVEAATESLREGGSVLILGAAFKENVRDCRNSKALEIAKEIVEKGFEVTVCDPVVYDHPRNDELYKTIGVVPEGSTYDLVILAVEHQLFLDLGLEGLLSYRKLGGLFYDLKNAFPEYKSDFSL